MKEKKKIILLIVLFAFVLTFFFVPQVNRIMKEVFRVFATGDFRVLRDFVAHYGVYAALVSFLLMVFQSLAAPLPAFLITFANANLSLDGGGEPFFHGHQQWQGLPSAFM